MPGGSFCGPLRLPAPAIPADADAATVRRLVEGAILPDLLARETATALLESTGADAIVVFVTLAGGETRVLASAGCDAVVASALARAAARGSREFDGGLVLVEALGKELDGARACAIVTSQPSDAIRAPLSDVRHCRPSGFPAVRHARTAAARG